MVTAGRVRGRRFILVPPFTLKVHGSGRVLIGDDVMVARGARLVARDAELALGDRTFISQNVTLVAFAPLMIGEGTLIGENCSVHTENHGPPGARDDFSMAPITVGRDVWLGSGVAVLPGSRVGDGATVGANAVVRGDLERGGTYVGVPARRVR